MLKLEDWVSVASNASSAVLMLLLIRWVMQHDKTKDETHRATVESLNERNLEAVKRTQDAFQTQVAEFARQINTMYVTNQEHIKELVDAHLRVTENSIKAIKDLERRLTDKEKQQHDPK